MTESRRAGGAPGRARYGAKLAAAAVAACIIAGVAAGLAGPSGATTMPNTSVLSILAIVNDEPISAFDLNERLNLIIRSSSLPDTAATRRRLAPRILQTLVNESLQIQEAKRLNIQVSSKEMQEAYRRLESQSHLPKGKLFDFLESRGIARATLERQVRAALLWRAVIRRQFAPTTVVTDAEIDRALGRYEKNAGKPLHLVAEIFLAVESPSEDAAVLSNARKIIDEIKRGAPFQLLARQFSQSASARNGGDLGWVQAGQLDPEVEKTLEGMKINHISDPIRTAAGYTIVLLRGRRAPRTAKAGEARVSLREILVPLPKGASDSDVASQHKLAETVAGTVKGCDDFARVGKELGSTLPGSVLKARVGELAPAFRRQIAGLAIGVASKPVRTQDGLRVVMVCAREAVKSQLPTRERIRRLLLTQRLEARARRYLRDLRQTAFVDIRV